MSAELKEFPNTRRQECKDDCVKLLKEVLERAEKGEIIGCAISVIVDDQRTQSMWSETDHVALLLGAVTLTKARLEREIMSDDRA